MNKLTLLIMCFCFVSLPAKSAERFFAVLYDVPVLVDLDPVPELSYSYDKAGGKIAHAAALTLNDKPNVIYAAYAQSLGQFGWQKMGKHAYAREGQILSISHESLDKSWLFHFTLRPKRENSHK